MKKRLWFSKMDSSGQFPDGRIKLEVTFKDDYGSEFIWTPRWKEEVEPLFLGGLRVEKTNNPKSQYLESFARVARDAFQEAKGLSEAYFVTGRLFKVRSGQLLLCRGSDVLYYVEPEIGEPVTRFCEGTDSPDKECNVALPVGFEITERWLLDNLGQELKCLVINGVIVQAEALL